MLNCCRHCDCDEYCPCCGRRKQKTYPWYPAHVYPWWPDTGHDYQWPRWIEPNVGKTYDPTRPTYMI